MAISEREKAGHSIRILHRTSGRTSGQGVKWGIVVGGFGSGVVLTNRPDSSGRRGVCRVPQIHNKVRLAEGILRGRERVDRLMQGEGINRVIRTRQFDVPYGDLCCWSAFSADEGSI